MKKLLLLIFVVALASTAHAQSTSSSWIDITAFPYNAKRDCSADAGVAINSAISSAPAGSGVIFFPTGCYLIQTQIVDTNSSAFLTYLGEGNVELRASTSTPPTNSIIQFGNDTPTTVHQRKIENLKFNCNTDAIDGVDVDGLTDSEFDGVSITYCRIPTGGATWHLRTVGLNVSDYNDAFFGGVISADQPNANGISLGANSAGPSATWSFHGTKILNDQGSPTGTGVELDGSGSSFYGATISGWQVGINLSVNTPTSTPRGGFEISGSYLENNAYAAIRVGGTGYPGSKVNGVTISGNYINCNSGGKVPQYGVDIEQAQGFTIVGNDFRECTTYAVRGMPDGTDQGADGGFVGGNTIDGGQGMLLQGSGNTVTSSIST